MVRAEKSLLASYARQLGVGGVQIGGGGGGSNGDRWLGGGGRRRLLRLLLRVLSRGAPAMISHTGRLRERRRGFTGFGGERALPFDTHELSEIVALLLATGPFLHAIVEHRLRTNTHTALERQLERLRCLGGRARQLPVLGGGHTTVAFGCKRALGIESSGTEEELRG